MFVCIREDSEKHCWYNPCPCIQEYHVDICACENIAPEKIAPERSMNGAVRTRNTYMYVDKCPYGFSTCVSNTSPYRMLFVMTATQGVDLHTQR